MGCEKRFYQTKRRGFKGARHGASKKLHRPSKETRCVKDMVKDTSGGEVARAHLKSARYKEAIKCYKKILKRNPRDDAAWLSMGGAHRALGEYEKAIACYDRAIEIIPRRGRHWS